MPRSVTVVLPSVRTGDFVEELRRVDGLLTLQVLRAASVKPPGDVVSVQMTDASMPSLMHMLDRYGSGVDSGVSVTMSEPGGLVSASGRDAIARDPASSTLEEMDFMMGRESNMRLNKVAVMLLAGVIATVGVASNSVHVVVGAMVIAPGFEPLLRIALGLVGGGGAWRRGVADVVKGYAALVAGAALAAMVLPLLGVSVPSGSDGYLLPNALVVYWSQVTVSGTATTIAAGLAGAFLVAGNRSVLTAGVMIALSLVPAATLAAVGTVRGDLSLAADSALRWIHDALIVTACGLVVLGGKRANRRRTLRA